MTPEKIDAAIKRAASFARIRFSACRNARWIEPTTLLATRDGFKDERVLGRFDAVHARRFSAFEDAVHRRFSPCTHAMTVDDLKRCTNSSLAEGKCL